VTWSFDMPAEEEPEEPSRATQALAALSNPAVSLRAFGKVRDQETPDIVPFDPEKITYELQNTVVSYVSNPPLNALGQTYWLALLGYRQAGKSLTCEICGYVKAAYNPGWDHVCIADTKDRAEYLHKRVHLMHENWPESLRTATVSSREHRQKTFTHGGQMRVLSGDAGAVGIGQSPDFWHGSELPYWRDAAAQITLTIPSIINKKHCLVLFESTPAPMNESSAEWWRDFYRDAKKGGGKENGAGRWLSRFFPFWDGKLNVRPWASGMSMDNDEIRLLEKYGPKGLKKEHLAFRRLLMETDVEIRKNPDLFGVYYPFDDITCWLATDNQVIHKSLLERHENGILIPWPDDLRGRPHYAEFEAPEAGAIYVIGCDPIGYGARDHGAFQVLKCFSGEWTQVAVFAGITDPNALADELLRVAERYHNALVGVERNGVGEGFLGMLIDRGYENLYYAKPYKPGIWKQSEAQMLGYLTTALKDELKLYDDDTVGQLGGYGNDREVQRSVKAEIMATRKDRRRDRGHWDKVSALMIAVVAARDAPLRFKQKPSEDQENVLLFKDMTYDQVEKYREKAYKKKDEPRRRARYRSTRRRK